MTDGESVSIRVVKQIADREGIDPVNLRPPLHSVVNTDALDDLFQSTTQSNRSPGFVEFEYQGYTVRVESSGAVRVVDSAESSMGSRQSAEDLAGD